MWMEKQDVPVFLIPLRLDPDKPEALQLLKALSPRAHVPSPGRVARSCRHLVLVLGFNKPVVALAKPKVEVDPGTGPSSGSGA